MKRKFKLNKRNRDTFGSTEIDFLKRSCRVRQMDRIPNKKIRAQTDEEKGTCNLIEH